MRWLWATTTSLSFLLMVTPAIVFGCPEPATFIDDSIANGAHAISGDGSKLVFGSSNDLTGGNPDGNRELFMWSDPGAFLQLTDTTGTTTYWEFDVNDDGSGVMVVATADITSSGATHPELYYWTVVGGWTRLTTTAGTSSLVYPGAVGISSAGDRIMFTSRGDYAGINPTAELQVFLWDSVAGFTQITNGSPCGTGGGNFGRDLSGTGSRILFNSRCQYDTWNTDLQGDLFLWDESTGVSALTDEPNNVGAVGTLNSDGTIAALMSATDLVNGGAGSARHLFRWLEGSGFAQLTTEAVDNDRPSVNADGTIIAYTATNGQGTGGNPENGPELFLWQLGFPTREITDSEQTSSTSMGNERPDLDDSGSRLSMVALRAFDEPVDNRTGHFTIDLWLFADDFETGDLQCWSSSVP